MRAVLAVLWLIHWLPLPVVGRLGKAMGTLLYWLMRDRRHVTLTNLHLCFPEWNDAQRRQVARQHFQYFARSILERSILWWGSEARLNRLIRVEPPMPLEDIASGPVVLLCPHFVCLDVAGVAVAMRSPAASIYMRQRNSVFDAALRRGRERFMPVRLFTRQDGIKPILRALREKLPYFMLPDMDFGRKDSEFVAFFGQTAATLTALPRIAAASKAKVIPVIATFLPDYQGWTVRFYPPWEDYPGDDMHAATRRMNAFIEDRIREHPAEYFWAHRRFKTRPHGEPGLY